MGTKITDLIVSKEITLDDLKNKVLVVDAFNQLYMFLSSIRQPDGSLLKDSHGNITSHLNGIFYRYTKLLQQGIKLAFVFDGKPPALKLKERERRSALKQDAELKYDEAAAEGDLEEMKKFAARTSKLTKEMIADAKELIAALGCPVIQAPSEGEAQAAHIVKNKDAYASLSQDADSLLFGCPLVIKNLTLSGRRKKAGAASYDVISPELLSLKDTLQEQNIDQDQLIIIAMLTGTDYNIGGIKGIGPKKAMLLIKEFDHDFDALFAEAKWSESFEYSWKEVYDLIKHTEVTDDYSLSFKLPDHEKIIEILCDRHDFSKERIQKTLDTLKSANTSQKGLGEFF